MSNKCQNLLEVAKLMGLPDSYVILHYKKTHISQFLVCFNRLFEWIGILNLWLQVRAAAVFALGTFIACNTERTDHANNIDLSVGMTFANIAQDGSPLVRKVSNKTSLLIVQDSSLFHSKVATYPIIAQ